MNKISIENFNKGDVVSIFILKNEKEGFLKEQ